MIIKSIITRETYNNYRLIATGTDEQLGIETQMICDFPIVTMNDLSGLNLQSGVNYYYTLGPTLDVVSGRAIDTNIVYLTLDPATPVHFATGIRNNYTSMKTWNGTLTSRTAYVTLKGSPGPPDAYLVYSFSDGQLVLRNVGMDVSTIDYSGATVRLTMGAVIQGKHLNGLQRYLKTLGLLEKIKHADAEQIFIKA